MRISDWSSDVCSSDLPTDMKVMVAHKGKKSVRVHVRGLEAHSSLAPNGVNAVEYAAEAIAFLKGMARRIAKEGPFDDLFDIAHRSEERREGKECVSTVKSRWSP